jgi:hypothetical protein
VNPNDQIRQQILQYFYDRNANATSRTGRKGSAVRISDAKRELKERYGLKQPQVMANLTYLIDNGWVKTFDIEKTVTVPGGTVPSKTSWYEIAAPGIDKIEGGSQFEPKDRYPGINVTATGSNVIALGDGNVVNAQFSALHSELNDLKAAISATKDLNDGEKLGYAADIETIKDQLAKATPDKTIVGHVWSGLKAVATLSGVAAAYDRVTHLIGALLQ